MAARFVIAALALVCVTQVQAIGVGELTEKTFNGAPDVLAPCLEANKDLASTYYQYVNDQGNADAEYWYQVMGFMSRPQEAYPLLEAFPGIRSEVHDQFKSAIESGDFVAAVEAMQSGNVKISQYVDSMRGPCGEYIMGKLDESSHAMGNQQQGLELFARVFVCALDSQ